MIRELLRSRVGWGGLAVIDDEGEHAYRDLARRAAAVRTRLAEVAGERVAILLPNGADYISALFGIWMAGKVAFPLGVQLTGGEIGALLEQVKVSAVVSCAAYRQTIEQAGAAGAIYMEGMAEIEPGARLGGVTGSPDEPIVLLTTSGTTGRAKIVQLSERNIETAVLGFIAYNDYPRFGGVGIRYILGTPLSSVYGLLIMPVCMINGFPLVLTRGAFTLDALYAAVERHRVTHYEGGTAIPVLMDQMRDKEIPYDIGSLRFVGFGGSKVSDGVLRRLDSAFPNIEFCAGYGTTESASLIARPYKRIKMDKRDSIGTAIPTVAVAVDVGGAISREPMAVGELVVRGPNVMLGYYENEEETRKIIRNGWLYTGDIGYIDGDGDIFLIGRKKNVIMVRGFSVYAEEVEASIQSSGLAQDCVVYGETDDAGVEMLCADLIPAGEQMEEADVRAWCAAHLAGYKQPRRIRFVDAIRKNAAGKIERIARGTDGAD